jgi:hypothetical protein
MFIYRTQSHLAHTPHSSPDQLKVTQSRNSTRDFESSAGESGVSEEPVTSINRVEMETAGSSEALEQ